MNKALGLAIGAAFAASASEWTYDKCDMGWLFASRCPRRTTHGGLDGKRNAGEHGCQSMDQHSVDADGNKIVVSRSGTKYKVTPDGWVKVKNQ